MNEQKTEEPLLGFQITDYDKDKEAVTIEIHPLIFNNPTSIEKLVMKCIDMTTHGQSVKSVIVKPRDD